MHRRPNGEVPQYYYAAIEVRVAMTGYYGITSTSDADTYGSIYTDNFDPAFPDRNLLAKNDDDFGNGQFKLTVFLKSWNRYVLVATTFSPNVTGTFDVNTSGPGSVTFRF
ncbi:unnamed protein product [Rotaria socialis]|uniref:Uncharacterized protein n=1 Tax=Rotaria socialis TaxID=392032 RepID=A0A818GMS8_9BILA|nr:unnamed protein product [Rotaria socialis]CAF3492686.1 unnamed protein product [Rotaria socialis]CAF3518512.1 unnamed protein product [Rotaria socialis]CAF3548076.1 unnamed protein product [Rotaria socialis]CAF3568718.1 unnamed protein product [Rotaria socialis]